MPDSYTISTAARKITQGFKDIVQEAAGNATLTKTERGRITSGWAKRSIPNRRMTVDQAVDGFIAPKIRRALHDISSDGRHVTPTDVERLRVVELKNAAEALFGPGSRMERLQAVIDRLDVPQLVDYGRSIGISNYPAQSLAEVMQAITDYEYQDGDGFEIVSGSGAIADFAGTMRSIGREEKESVDEDPDGKPLNGDEIQGRYNAVAREVTNAFRPASQFKSVRSLFHSIAEDGDVEYAILLAQKRDDSWVAVVATDFPF